MVSAFAVVYGYAPERAEERMAGLDEHRAWLTARRQSGRLIEVGRLTGTPEGLLVLLYESEEEATADLDTDPYWRAGLVAAREITRWEVSWGIVADAARAFSG